jgi:hypothetical protein
VWWRGDRLTKTPVAPGGGSGLVAFLLQAPDNGVLAVPRSHELTRREIQFIGQAGALEPAGEH